MNRAEVKGLHSLDVLRSGRSLGSAFASKPASGAPLRTAQYCQQSTIEDYSGLEQSTIEDCSVLSAEHY